MNKEHEKAQELREIEEKIKRAVYLDTFGTEEPFDFDLLETPLGDELDSGWAPEDDLATYNTNDADDYRDE